MAGNEAKAVGEIAAFACRFTRNSLRRTLMLIVLNLVLGRTAHVGVALFLVVNLDDKGGHGPTELDRQLH